MQRLLILSLILALGAQAGFCESIMFPPLQKAGGSTIQSYSDNMPNCANSITSLPDQFVKPTNAKIGELDKIEMTLFGKNFSNQTTPKRLARIEQKLFAQSYSTASDDQRIDNIISNFNQMNKYPNISSGTLTKIERQVLNQTFEQNGAKRRIERLEEQMFGAVQSGDLTARYDAVKMAAQNFKNRNLADTDNYFNPKANLRRGLSFGFGNGRMTGYTPNINPFNASNFNDFDSGYYNPAMYNRNSYSNNYNTNTNSNSSSGPYGFRNYNGTSSFGSGAGVTILD